ncbi:MAG: NAD(P)-dependent oxidoreductase [Anaerolineaceae bacterium]|nr:NAD(P)-dependent oxidoreductase [Anaerolineaceae bacterium]MDE0329446.1 NAD(P)-dependent oxidoreductase [Anaerolineaceae bacterium]
MTGERTFVTGALGCIGAWVTRNLLRSGAPVTIFDLGTDRKRLELILDPGEIARIEFIQGDVTDTEAVAKALQGSGARRIIHLAALQVPFCRANPPLGASVNVIGTINIFEAAKALGIDHVVYAGSAAVYGRGDEYDRDIIENDAPFLPKNLYGVFKLANQGTAQIYRQDHGINSIGLRPYTVYGPGRDQGMTSTPTRAMLAAAAGQPWHISFGGRNGFQFTDDVAKIFIRAASLPDWEGAESFNLGGSIAHMSAVVAAIEGAAPEVTGQITFEDAPLALPAGTSDRALVEAIGPVPCTPLEEGVAYTIAHFRDALSDGRIALDEYDT